MNKERWHGLPRHHRLRHLLLTMAMPIPHTFIMALVSILTGVQGTLIGVGTITVATGTAAIIMVGGRGLVNW
jgi:hypothetical protein